MTLEKAGFKVIRRESGNYGKVKSKYSPPKIKVASHIETFLRFIYFRCGVQRLLYSISTKLNMGNGINIFCRPSGKIA